MNPELALRIWEWLPGRTDGRRVTLPATIATALDVEVGEVSRSLVEMERAGHAIRDAATGTQMGWHRGTRPPSARSDADTTETELTLY